MTPSGNSVKRCLSHKAFVGLFGAGYLDQEANKSVIGAAREAAAAFQQ